MIFCTTRAARRGAVAAGLLSALGGALGVSTASAVPVSVTLDYVCTFPLLKPQPLSLQVKSDIPATIEKNKGTGAFNILGVATVSPGAVRGLRAVDTATLEGTAAAGAVVTKPGGAKLPLTVQTTITKASVPASGAFNAEATGTTPSLFFNTAGVATITVGDLALSVTPRLPDGQLTGLDSFETECTQVPGQDNTLATITVTDGAAVEPIVSYTVGGSASVNGYTRVRVPLNGTATASLTTATGAFTSVVELDPVSAKLKVLGFLPVDADLEFDSTSPMIGTLKSGVLTSTAKVQVKVPSVTFYGIPLGGGANCQAQDVSTVSLASTAGFDMAQGGALAGTISMTGLTGCGALTNALSTITAGGKNLIALKLTPKPTV